MAPLRDDRALSVVATYVVALGVAVLVVGGVVLVSDSIVDREQRAVMDDDLREIGERVAGDIESVDRMVRTNASNASVDADLPRHVAGSPYRIQVNVTNGNGTVELTTVRPTTSVTVPFTNRTPVQNGSVSGGPIRVRNATDGVEVVDG